jgi:tape measure domain-containing protein
MSGRPVEIEYLLKDGISGGLKKIEGNATTMGRTVEREGERIGGAFKQAAASALAFFSVAKAAEYGRSIIQIRGEMQGLGLAFETMLGSKEKADKMMSEVMEFAMGTPYTVTEVADNVKQLIAMNAAGDDVMATFKALGDVAAGVNVPISRIAINYGQVAALGKLQGREIRDFAMAGIPIVSELAKQFNVAESEIMSMVEAGQVGFPAVQRAFASMADEGGKFHNMMEKLNSTVTGQLSRLQDAIQQMMNKIGESSEGLIYKGIDGVSYLIENYEKIGRILGVLITSYGAYRAALIATVTVQKVAQAVEWIRLFNQQTAALTRMTQAQILLNKAVGANPYIKLASILMTVGGLIWAFAKNTDDSTRAIGELESQIASETDKVNTLAIRLTNTNTKEEERRKIIEEIRALQPSLVEGINSEAVAYGTLTQRLKEYNEAQIVRAAQAQLLDEESNAISTLNSARTNYKVLESQAETELANFRNTLLREGQNYMLRQFDEIATSDLTTLQKLREILAKFTTGHGTNVGGISKKGLEDIYEALREVDKEIIAADINVDRATYKVKGFVDTFKKVIDQSTGGETRAATVKNKEFWETQKKGAENALAAMEASAKGGKEWNEQVRLLNEANSKLRAWDFGGSVKESNQVDSILDQQEKVNQLLEKQALDRKRVEEDLENQVSQARIQALQDGFEKQRQQREYDNNLELQSLERQKEDYIREVTEAAKQIFDKQEELKREQDKNYVKGVFDPEALAIDTSVFDQIIAYVRDRQIKDEQNSARELLNNYGSYLEKRAALADEWEKKIAELPEKYREGARAKMTADLAAMDDEYQKFSDGLDDLFHGASTRSVAELEKILNKAKEIQDALQKGDYEAYTAAEGNSNNRMTREQFDTFRNSPGQMKELSDRVDDTTRKVFQAQNAFKRLGQAVKDAIDPKSKDKKQAFSDIVTAIGEINDLAVSVGGSIGQIFSAFGDDATAETIGTLTDMVSGVGELGAGIASFASGDILGGIQGVFAGIAKIATLFADNEQALIDAENAAREYSAALREIERTRRLSLFDTIFGTDGIGKFQEASKIVDESLGAIRTQIDAIQNRKNEVLSRILDRTIYDSIEATYDGRSAWNKFWGTGDDKIKNVYFDINDYINTDGSLKLEDLENWYEQYKDALDSSERQILEDLIANGQAYEEAIAVMTEHLEELWGNLASSIADNMIDAFLETGDAAKNLGDVVEDVSRNMAKSMIESMLTEEIFNEDLQNKLLDLLKIGDQEGANKLIQDAIAGAGELAPLIEGIIESLGLMKDNAVTQTGKAGTFQTMSQDTGTKLEGLFTAMRMVQEEMNRKMDELGPGLGEATGVLVEIRDEVKQSNGWLGRIYERIEVMIRDGVKVK